MRQTASGLVMCGACEEGRIESHLFDGIQLLSFHGDLESDGVIVVPVPAHRPWYLLGL